MDLNSTSKQTTPIPPTDSVASGTASMFNNAQNTIITGGSFNITSTANISTVDRFDVLHKRVAPNAILNAGGRADEVRCHPGTREEVIGRIEKWRDADYDLTAPIFWLSGPAGAGKTAIVQTIAERCEQHGQPQANFFFFRADSTRSTATSLVATLLHQIILLYPALRDPVTTVLSANPLIFNSLIAKQLTQLIVGPLRAIQQSTSSYRPPTLLIDGLDECDSESKRSQQQILHAFDKILAEHPCPIRLLVASRDESQIKTAFNGISSSFLPLYLDSEYSPESDIRVFVIDKFEAIRETHPLAYTLDATWPSVEDVDDIVMKSSGQFIYAATVMRFILDSSASPALSLERVQGAAPITTKSPFSHLDAIYSYILSQADDQEALKDILHAQLLLRDFSSSVGLTKLLRIYTPSYTQAVVHSCLTDLTPIALYTNKHELLFHHASFPDYLLDKLRSRDYFVDIDAFNIKILPTVWKGIPTGMKAIAYAGLLRLQNLPPDFLNTLIAMNPSEFCRWGHRDIIFAFKHIYDLCVCDDDMIKYKQIIRAWINTLSDYPVRKAAESLEDLPCSRRYFIMAHIERNIAIIPLDETAIALCPETNFDTRETALWLNDLLSRIHREKYHDSVQDYQELISEWISWAVRNDIPLDNLDSLPDARWYFWKHTIARWTASYLKFGNDYDQNFM